MFDETLCHIFYNIRYNNNVVFSQKLNNKTNTDFYQFLKRRNKFGERQDFKQLRSTYLEQVYQTVQNAKCSFCSLNQGLWNLTFDSNLLMSIDH